MKSLLYILIVLISLMLWKFYFTDTLSASKIEATTTNLKDKPPLTSHTSDSLSTNQMTDPRDGETYPIVKIGKQIWMAENLRYDAPGTMINLENPSKAYGRLYDGNSAQTACPKGWHLPSDSEWNELEMTLGMPAADTSKTFWRGTHGTKLKSSSAWWAGKDGTNSSGFNGLPAGHYFPGTLGGTVGMDDIGASAGFWCSSDGPRAWIRFLGAPLEGVNRFDDDKSSGFAISCRCVKD